MRRKRKKKKQKDNTINKGIEEKLAACVNIQHRVSKEHISWTAKCINYLLGFLKLAFLGSITHAHIANEPS